MTPALTVQPFRLYGIACRFGWEAEAKHASTQTLQYNLYDPEIRPLLQRLSTDSLLDLMELHRLRREGYAYLPSVSHLLMKVCRLRQRLNDPPFVAGSTATCVSCHNLIDYHTWRELKYKIILEMDTRPLGDTVIEVDCWNGRKPWHVGLPSARRVPAIAVFMTKWRRYVLSATVWITSQVHLGMLVHPQILF